MERQNWFVGKDTTAVAIHSTFWLHSSILDSTNLGCSVLEIVVLTTIGVHGSKVDRRFSISEGFFSGVQGCECLYRKWKWLQTMEVVVRMEMVVRMVVTIRPSDIPASHGVRVGGRRGKHSGWQRKHRQWCGQISTSKERNLSNTNQKLWEGRAEKRHTRRKEKMICIGEIIGKTPFATGSCVCGSNVTEARCQVF